MTQDLFSRAELLAFADELVKLAEIAPVEKARELHAAKSSTDLTKKLKPGDLLFTAPDKKGYSLFSKIYKPISRSLQGTDFGHAAVYVGKGKIIDARMGREVKKIPLADLAKNNDIVAVTPKATTAQRKKAVEYAHASLGKKFSLGGILRSATPFRGKRQGEAPEQSASLICSGLAANAYSDLKFSDKSRLYTRPSEILTSKLVKPVGTLERHNA